MRREQAGARGGELDRQRQPVQSGADLSHGGGVLRREVEGWIPISGPLDEEPHRRRGGDLLNERVRIFSVPSREIERRDRDEPFPTQAQRFPAGHQRADSRAGGEQIGERRRGRQEVLEIIQQQERAARAEPLVDAHTDRSLAQVAEPERAGDGGHGMIGPRQRGEIDEHDPIWEIGSQVACDLDRQPGLPGSAGTGQGDKSRGLDDEALPTIARTCSRPISRVAGAGR